MSVINVKAGILRNRLCYLFTLISYHLDAIKRLTSTDFSAVFLIDLLGMQPVLKVVKYQKFVLTQQFKKILL